MHRILGLAMLSITAMIMIASTCGGDSKAKATPTTYGGAVNPLVATAVAKLPDATSTALPPTAVPPTAVPPTVIPPTAIPPTEPPVIVATPIRPACHPSYQGACLKINAGDYDCAGGSGNGPNYTGRVTVVGPDVFDLDRDGDGIGCE